ncbi:MAG: prohibitin family protein [Gemmatimonadetes bacterium]|nr:prohibitin family protein [Gemmatimonadota bacterium]
MFEALMAALLIAVGGGVRLLAPAVGTASRRSPTAVKVAGNLVAGLGVVVLVASSVSIIGVGEVGVKHFLGRIDPDVLEQGVHFVNPLASIEKLSIREQNYPSDGSVERMEAQTSEQLTVALEVSLLYRFDGTRGAELYQRLGNESEIKNRIVLNAVRNGVRDAIATKSINEVFSPNRRELASAMRDAIQSKAGDRIEVIDVFVRDIQAPPVVKDAIEQKLAREQQVAAERFQTEIIAEKAKQRIEEAQGIAEAQRIINVDLTDRYLMLRYIEALQNLPSGSLIVAPTQGGMPLLLNPGNR